MSYSEQGACGVCRVKIALKADFFYQTARSATNSQDRSGVNAGESLNKVIPVFVRLHIYI
ncbi:hypothetical protein AGMMS50267_11460 [Spirochaetia bacterium]|nr:hypothetical protein AGMMS50267_11460 [Spirochaetia bacterium]